MRDNNNNRPTKDQAYEFIVENFSLDSELEVHTPADWQSNPPALMRIKDEKFRQWALDLNEIWKTLIRKVKPEVWKNPQRHSLIHVENPFIVPGGRFRGEIKRFLPFFFSLDCETKR